ncbi:MULTISPECIES: GNAT family N-acetyltransferase [Exiguobacterium]|jgi:RimJ/RimL family protein N-acetyltransferase|uniref:GNAT family N-acetyltransferase n=1 Tax=Exiguobacterium TaxID=33986 RepID=UPI00049794C0|nr:MULTISPECIES: GNAT family N-acetyltransferase [Exiguobacterium]TCI69219.1 N-acetyltransferase [Exiguobacterium sp. IPCI3]TCI78679.1 N-acetyltransferase [Exiguobacterium sp. IPCH1]TCI81183.1 N-acetyltransferase [Exiguobacterium sp. IPBC4]
MIQLDTDRLQLRAFQLEDAEQMFRYAQDERVGPKAGWAPHQSVEETRDVIRLFQQDQDVWAITLKETGEVIGSLGLHDRRPDPEIQHDRQREIGYVLSPDHWGQGYIPEAVHEVMRHGFDDLDLERIWCGHFDFNDQSRRVVEKTGFTYVFTTSQQLTRLDGRTVQSLIYVVTKDEYEERRAQ